MRQVWMVRAVQASRPMHSQRGSVATAIPRVFLITGFPTCALQCIAQVGTNVVRLDLRQSGQCRERLVVSGLKVGIGIDKQHAPTAKHAQAAAFAAQGLAPDVDTDLLSKMDQLIKSRLYVHAQDFPGKIGIREGRFPPGFAVKGFALSADNTLVGRPARPFSGPGSCRTRGSSECRMIRR